MRFLDLRQAVIDNIDSGITTHLVSPPGLGKSDFVHQLVDWLSKRDGFEWGFVTCFLGTMTPSDLLGYMVPTRTKNPDGSEFLASTFTVPPWMMTAPTPEYPNGRHINTFQRGIVFLDEWGQADGDVKKAAAPLILDGHIGPHRLHKGIAVVKASNRKNDRSGVSKEFDFVINREEQLHITPDLESWQDWAATSGVTPLTMAFAQQNPNIVFSEEVPKEQGAWTTPRSLVAADRLMRVKAKRTGKFPDDPATVEQVQGIMGAGSAQYFAFVKLEREMPKYEDIIKDPSGVKVPTKPDAMMLICYQLAHMIKPQDAGPVVEYMERLPKEFSMTFATTACKRQPSLVMTAAFSKWAKQNSNLMALIAQVGK